MRLNKLFVVLLACMMSVGGMAQSATSLPYSTGFEDATDNALWQYANATTNQWCIGSAANNGGSNALYISNDGGKTNNYTSNNTVSFAYRAFHFEKGDYVISFDWLCLGEPNDYGSAPYDCMRIILTPASITLQGTNSYTGTLGELTSFGRNTTTAQVESKGYIQLNCSNPYQANYPFGFLGASTWQSGESCEISISTEGDYYLVLCWYNDSGAKNPAATVDNLLISKKACGNIQDIATSAISSNSVTLTWGKVEEAIGYDYAVLPTSGSLDESLAVRTADTVVTVNGLSANTEHVAYIRAICTEGAGSWKKATFRTDCAAQSLPYTEGFEGTMPTGSDVMPYCWNRVAYNNYSTTYPHIYNSNYSAHSGDYSLYFSGGSSYSEQIAILPTFAADPNQLMISFYYKNYYLNSSDSKYPQFIVGVMSDPADKTTFVAADTLEQKTSFAQAKVYLSKMPATHKYIAIKYACGSSSTYGYVDDITVDYLPTCIPAQNIHIGATTQTSATIAWEAGKDESSWNVRYSAVGSKDTVSTVVSGTPELTINGLKHSTAYTYWVSVQSDCGGNDKAEISTKTLAFATECALMTAVRDSILIDFEEYDDKQSFNDIPCWSTFVGKGSHSYTWAIATTAYQGARAAELNNLNDNTRSSILATPQMEIPEGSELSMYIRSGYSSSSSANDSVLVYINTNQTLEGATRLGKITDLTAEYEMHRFSIPVRGNYYILIESYSYNSVLVDNILISPEPACLPPTKIVLGAVTSHTVSFSWTPGKNETQWLVSAENKSGSVFLEDEVVDGDPTFTISDLEAATTDEIEVSVRSVCDDVPSVEVLQGTLNFTTTCDPSNHTTAVAGDTLLYTSFEADDENESFATGWDANAHICWTNERIGGTGSDNITWQVAAGFYSSHSGTQYLRIVNSSSTRPYILFALPAMIFNAGQEVGLSFYAHGDSSDSIVVYINDKPALDGATRVGGTGSLKSDYVRYEIEPFATLEGVNYVFLYIEHQISGDTYLDDLTLRMTPTCRKVKEAEIENITTTSATLKWTPAYQENAWHAVVVNGTDTIVDAMTTTPSVAINGLQPATKYALHVTIAAVCDEVETAEKYDETMTIITDCEVITEETWTEGFEDMETVGNTITATDGPRCWNILDANQADSKAQVYIVGNSTAAHSGNKGMTMVLKSEAAALTSAYALLPQIENIRGKQIVFWRKAADYRTGPIEVGYMAQNAAGKDVWTSISKFEYNTKWVEEKVVLECPDTVQNPQFGFRYYTTSYSYSTSQAYIDDVKVRPVPVCDMGTNVRVVDSLATANSATIAWSGHADVGYTVIFCGEDTITKQVDDTICVLDGLKSSAILKYQVNVVARCAAGEAVDTLSADLQMITKCGGAITAFPYKVGFEEEDGYKFDYSNPIMPECVVSKVLGSQNYNLRPYNASSDNIHSGNQCLYILASQPTYNKTYISSFAFPETIIPEENAYEFTIWAKVSKEGSYNSSKDSVEVFYNTKSQVVDSNAVKIGVFKPAATYARYDVTLPAAGSQYVIIKAWANNGMVFFDDMSIRKIPSCFPVENVRVSETGLDTARIAWDTKNEGASYHVVLTRSDSTLYDGVVSDTVLVVRNLASSSNYTVQATITTICADGEESADVYEGSLSFSTKCGTISEFPWIEDFEAYSTGDFSNPCWENKSVAGDNTKLFTIVYNQYGTDGNKTHVLQLPDKQVGNYTQLTLPTMDIPEAGAYDFYLDVDRHSGSSKPGEGVFILADTDTLGFVPRQIGLEGINVPTESEAAWYTYHFTIPNAGVQNIIILGQSQYGSATNMDNFMVKANGKVPSALPTTGESHEKAIKFIHQNQVYILRNGVIYNALGQRVEALK